MRSPARILFVLFTLLLTVQGEPVLGARTKVIVRPAAGRSVPEEAYGICLPVRLSCDGVAVCGYDAQLPTGERVAALSADELAARGVPRLDDVVRQKFPVLHTGWYSGRAWLPEGLRPQSFDYIKLGGWVEELGPLT